MTKSKKLPTANAVYAFLTRPEHELAEKERRERQAVKSKQGRKSS